MKKISFVLGILLIIASLFAMAVSAAGETAVAQTNAVSTVAFRGDEIEFTVSVDTPITVKSGSVSLVSEDGSLYNYPKKDIELISGECNVSNVFTSGFDIDEKKGSFEFSEPTEISGVLFTVRFKVLDDAAIATSKVEMIVQLTDAEGDAVNVTNKGAEFTVDCAHEYQSQVIDAKNLKYQPDCTNKAVYYYVCKYCGAKGEDTFEYGSELGHLWSDTYTGITEGHFRTCLREGCGEDEALGEHIGGEATCTAQAVCDICKNTYGNTLPHDFEGGEWKSDDGMHWKQCKNCSAEDSENKIEHQYDNYTSNEDDTHTGTCVCGDVDVADCSSDIDSANCTSKAVCDVCNTVFGDYGAHEYTDEWIYDDNEHWHECAVCGDKSEQSEHSYDYDCDAYCNICGRFRTTVHSYNTPNHNDSEHWYECECGEKDADTIIEHVGGEATCSSKAVCDECNNEYGDYLPHEYSDEWTYNEDDHWRECSCGMKTDVSGHIYESICDEYCKTCEYRRTVIHIYIVTNFDENDHWIECVCGEEEPDSRQGHTGGEATCILRAICDECNAEYGDLADHLYSDEWMNNADSHWHECVCGDKADIAEHSYDNDCDEFCNLCEYERTVTHSYIKFNHDEYEHWFECTCGAKRFGSAEAHKGGVATCTSKAVCSVCNTEYGDFDAHSYSKEWSKDKDAHWHECMCGDIADQSKHEYGNDNICDVCEYVSDNFGDNTEPETTEPETTEPETTEPETTEPETTEPETTEPETTEPETTEPETTEPETTEPETTEPETTEPETTEPETTEPETTEPETTEPETTEPETTEPETTEPETTEPETTEPETTEPETTEPETTEPETTEPETDDPTEPDDRITYIFKYYDKGDLYAEDEIHVLDAIMTVITNDAFFTDELRLYQSPSHSATAIFSSTKFIESISVNAGYNDNVLKVWGSTDGEIWTLIDEISVSVKYSDYEVDMNGEEYTFIKLEASTEQIRLTSITVGYSDDEITPPETDDSETSDPETDDPETGDTESGGTETDDTESGDTETDDTESGDTESGDTETDDTESGDTETGDTESGDTETDDTESGDTETGDTESGDTETGDTESDPLESVDETKTDNSGSKKDEFPRELISIIIIISVLLLVGILFWIAFGKDKKKY